MIYGEINRQRLKIIREHVVADTIDYLEARFTFSSDWNGLEKWAHFSKNGTVYDIRLTDDGIRKEDHLNLAAGIWKVYLHGNEYRDGEVVERITTDTAVLEVRPTGTLDGEPFPEMPASVTEQILARLDNIEQNGGTGGGTGINPEVTVERTEDGAVITIRDKNGVTSAQVYDGEPGVYVGSETPPPGTKVWVNPDGEESEDDAVRYVPQELTPEQQAQARRNIDAATQEEVDKLSEAIADKADKAGWTPDKYIGTDAEGNLVEKDAPAGGGSGTVTSVNGNAPDETGNVTVEVGQPTDEQITTAVDTWLDEHPEATTTVADGSITPEKLSFYRTKPPVNTFADLESLEAVSYDQAEEMGVYYNGWLSESFPVDGNFSIINRSATPNWGQFCQFAPVYYDADGKFIKSGNTAGTDFVMLGNYKPEQHHYFYIITYIPPKNAVMYKWYWSYHFTDKSCLSYFDFVDLVDHKPWHSDDVDDLIKQNGIVNGNVVWNYQTDVTNSVLIDSTVDFSAVNFLPTNYADIMLNAPDGQAQKSLRIYLQAIDVRNKSDIYLTADFIGCNAVQMVSSGQIGVYAYDDDFKPLTAVNLNNISVADEYISSTVLEQGFDKFPAHYLYKLTINPKVSYLLPVVQSTYYDYTNPDFIRLSTAPFNPRYSNNETTAFEPSGAINDYIAKMLRPDYYKFRQIGRLVPNGNCNYVAWNHNTLHYDAARNVYVMTMRGSNAHGGSVNNVRFVKIDPITMDSTASDIVVDGVTSNWANGFTIDDSGTYIMICQMNDVQHYVTSTDGGTTWIDGGEITVDVSGTANVDTTKYDYTKFFNLHRLSTGTLIASYDDTVSPTNRNYQFVARSVDGINWTLIEIPGSDNHAVGYMTACEMSFYEHEGAIMMLGRRNSYQYNITDSVTGEPYNNAVKSYSYDDGVTWTASDGSDSVRANAHNVSIREHDGIVELMAMNRDFSKYPRGYIYHYTATPEEALADRFTLREVFQCNAYGAGDVTGGGLAFDRYGRGLFVYSDNHGTNSNYDYLHFLYGAKADAPAVCADGVASEFLPYSGAKTQELINSILSRLDVLETKL